MKALMCAAAIAAACMAGCESMNNNNGNSMRGMTGNNNGSNPMDHQAMKMENLGRGSNDLSAADKTFIASAASGGLYEVRSSQLALQKSKTDSVRQIAQHMIDDHSKANDELMNLARQKGLATSTSMNQKHQGMVDKLNGLDGALFDAEYLKQQRVAHQETVSLFLDETRQGSAADVKQWAQKTLPTLQSHLDMINARAANPAGDTNHNMNNMNHSNEVNTNVPR